MTKNEDYKKEGNKVKKEMVGKGTEVKYTSMHCGN